MNKVKFLSCGTLSATKILNCDGSEIPFIVNAEYRISCDHIGVLTLEIVNPIVEIEADYTEYKLNNDVINKMEKDQLLFIQEEISKILKGKR